MPATKHQPPFEIANRLCPVCGGPIAAKARRIELPAGRRGDSQVTLRCCSDACAEGARADAARYVAAARDDRRG